ncbi:GNAT family N-acetyltransferase [Salisaeta longa]|uniref:GNAT family N-acetyltransferase n=1 Tax=Salisaeta longa TaxID=503170 RepID=UPI0003B68D63|nr:GNAT family N-acetyltransferase [Salisaeta longa]
MTIRPVRTDDDWEGARAVRRRVFIEAQDCPPAEEWDGHDAASRHLVGVQDGAVIATARWRSVPHHEQIVAKLERFAVLPAHRGHGYGRALVQATLDDARAAGFGTFLLHAQAHLEAFYASFGFRPTGRRFTEVGIPHVEMIRTD